TTSLPNATRNQPYNQTIRVSGNTGATTFAIIGGALPTGLTLHDNGVIDGTATPASCQSFNFTVQATDSLGRTRSRTITISVVGSIIITSASLNAGVVLENYSSPVNASCGTGGRTWILTSNDKPLFQTSAGTFTVDQIFTASSPNSSSSN